MNQQEQSVMGMINFRVNVKVKTNQVPSRRIILYIGVHDCKV